MAGEWAAWMVCQKAAAKDSQTEQPQAEQMGTRQAAEREHRMAHWQAARWDDLRA